MVKNWTRFSCALLALLLLHTTGLTWPTAQQNKNKLHPTPDPTSPNQIYLPVDLEDAFRELKRMLSPELLAEMRERSEPAMMEYHLGVGMWIRNHWRLWADSKLAQFFHQQGIYHPEDMSVIILATFWCHLHAQPLRLEERVAYYREWARVHVEPKDMRCPQDGSPLEIVQWIESETPNRQPRCLHVARCKKNNHPWVYDVDRGLYKPDAELMKRLN